MSEAKMPGELIRAFHIGSKRVFANKFQGKNGPYYRINIVSENFDPVKIFMFVNEIDEYIKMLDAIKMDAANLEAPQPITEAPAEEPKPASATLEDKCDRCGGLSFDVFPGRGTQCVNCGKIYWLNNG